MKVGTILPTKASVAATERYAKRVAREKAAVAARHLRHCTPRVLGDETRHYDGPEKYAVVSRSGNVRWFRVTEEGDFAI